MKGAEGATGHARDGDPSRGDDLVFYRDGGADAGERQVASGLLELLVCRARGAWRQGGQGDRGDDLVLGQVGGEDALQEVVERASARTACCCYQNLGIQGEQHRGQIRGRVAVRDAAADRAPGAHLLVGEHGEGVGHRAEAGGDARVVLQGAVGGQGPDRRRSLVAGDAAEFCQAADVDERLRGGQPQLHQRQQGLAAGQQLGLLARGGRLGEQGQRVLQRVRAGVTEVGGKHCRGYASRSSSAAARAAATIFWYPVQR